MPATDVVFFLDEKGNAPAHDGLQGLLRTGKKREFAKCLVRIHRLAEWGFELRRPEAEYLRDGIYELRATRRRVHYRILYFFAAGQATAVLSHLITKETSVPAQEIERAIRHKHQFNANPGSHTLRIIG